MVHLPDIFLHWTSTYTKSHCTMYRKLFHVSAVKIISKCSDKICRKGQVFSHFASDFLAYLNLTEKCRHNVYIYIYILMHKRGRCRQYIVISGQQLVSDLSVMQDGTLAM